MYSAEPVLTVTSGNGVSIEVLDGQSLCPSVQYNGPCLTRPITCLTRPITVGPPALVAMDRWLCCVDATGPGEAGCLEVASLYRDQYRLVHYINVM